MFVINKQLNDEAVVIWLIFIPFIQLINIVSKRCDINKFLFHKIVSMNNDKIRIKIIHYYRSWYAKSSRRRVKLMHE